MNASTYAMRGGRFAATGSAKGRGESQSRDEVATHTSDLTTRSSPTGFELEEPVPPCPQTDSASACHPIAQIKEQQISHLGGGINGTYTVTGTVDDKPVKVVYKPENEQKTTSGSGFNDYDEVSVTEPEATAYDVDHALGLGITPQTDIVRDLGTRGKGSAQQWIDAPTGSRVSFAEKQKVHPSQWYKLAVLDSVIRNHDRHSGNFLVKNGRVYAIDHGYAFPKTTDTSTVSGARDPEEDALPDHERAELVHRLRTTDWAKAKGIAGNAGMGHRTRAGDVRRDAGDCAGLSADQNHRTRWRREDTGGWQHVSRCAAGVLQRRVCVGRGTQGREMMCRFLRSGFLNCNAVLPRPRVGPMQQFGDRRIERFARCIRAARWQRRSSRTSAASLQRIGARRRETEKRTDA
jgi:Phosphatidylinositol 3- and 4-kinase